MTQLELNLVNAVMNPVRQRIAEYLILHGSGTVKEMAAALSDVPVPTLYRHLNVLRRAGLVRIVSERAVRGARERTYALAELPRDAFTAEDVGALFQGTILSLAGSFARYFGRKDADPERDMLSVSSSTLLLSDAELLEMFRKIGEIYNGVLANEPRPDRRARCLTIISSPAEPGRKGE